MLDRIFAFLDRWRQLQSVEAFTDRDLADLGLSRDQVRAFLSMPADVTDRVGHMARIFNVPDMALRASHADYLHLLETCAECRDRASCSLALSKGDITRPADAAFCPNAPVFAARSAAA